SSCVAACGCAPIQHGCDDLPNDCGDSESCCSTLCVTGGTFSRGYDASDTAFQGGEKVFGWAERQQATARVSSFWLDRFEVTVGRFRKFIDVYDAWRRAGNPQDGRGALPQQSLLTGWRLKEWSGLVPADSATFSTALATAPGCDVAFRSWT